MDVKDGKIAFREVKVMLTFRFHECKMIEIVDLIEFVRYRCNLLSPGTGKAHFLQVKDICVIDDKTVMDDLK